MTYETITGIAALIILFIGAYKAGQAARGDK